MRKKEYILSNKKGNKIYLSFQHEKSGDYARIGLVSINERKTDDEHILIQSGPELEILKKLAETYPSPFNFSNNFIANPRGTISNLNVMLITKLFNTKIITSKNFREEYYFIGNKSKNGWFFRNCVINDHVYDSMKDKIELLKMSSTNRFQFFADSSSFTGRAAELRYLTEMCENTDAPFCWTSICGKGGTGKSRIALELCERLSKEGWIVYPPAHARIKVEQIKNDIEKTDTDMVICFDDVNSDIENVLNFMNYCIETPFRQNQIIRLILIDRDFEHSPLMSSSTLLFRYHSNATTDPEVTIANGSLELKKPSPDEIFDIMHSFVEKIYKKDLTRLTFDEMLYPELQKIDKNERPLFALLIADAWGYGMEKYSGYTYQNDALDMLYILENNRIRELINMEYKKPSEQQKALEAAKCCILLCSFLYESEAIRHKKLLNEMTHLEMDDSFCWVMEHAGFMKDSKLINPFPDILAEYFSLSYINSIDIENKDRLILLIEHLLRKGKTRTLNFAAQICDDYSDNLISPSNMSVFQYLTSMYRDIHSEQWRFLDGMNTHQDFQHVNTNDIVYEYFIKQLRNKFSSSVDYGKNINDPIYHNKGFDASLSDLFDWDDERKNELSKYPNDIAADFDNISDELVINFFEQNKDKIFIRSDDPVLSDALSLSNYKGQILFDSRWGEGTFELPDCTYKYEGEWNMNCANGKGIEISQGDTYDGFWKDGRKCGYGIMTYLDKTKYEGEWLYDERYGHGTITRPDKVSFECEWASGWPSGIVEMSFPYKKDVLKGEWDKGTIKKVWKPKSGKLQGDEIVWSDGTRYLGDKKGTVPDGKGKLTLFDRRIYDGTFIDGLPNGIGRMTWYQWKLQPRKEYNGEWKDGKCHGHGIMIYADESVYDGHWENDERSGKGNMTYADESKYTGDWKENVRWGKGDMKYANDNIYSGKWKHDIKFGDGKWIYPDGTVVPVYSNEEGTLTEDGEKVTEDGRIIPDLLPF